MRDTVTDTDSMNNCPSISSDDPSTRREFLTKVARTSAGLLLPPSLLLGATSRPANAFDLFPKPSPDQQKKVGRQAAEQILKQYREVHDERADAFRHMGERLVAALSPDDQKWDFNFHVLDSKEINAFALPGGPMFMFTGLYNLISTLDAMAAVTGHEMTHVRKEHWAKAYQQQQKRNLAVVGIGLIFSHSNAPVADIASLGSNAIGKKYSRGEEDEADAGGLENMVNAGFNPQGMVELFTVLQKVSGNGGGVGGDFLSDHPLTSARINKAKERIATYKDRQFPPMTPLLGSKAAGPVPPVVPATAPPPPTH